MFSNHQLGNGYGRVQAAANQTNESKVLLRLFAVLDGDLDVDSRLERSRGDLLHDLLAGLHVQEALQKEQQQQQEQQP